MNKRDELIPVEVRLMRPTDGSWFVRATGMTVDVTLPRSRVEFPEDAEVDQVVELLVPRWLVEEKGLDIGVK